VMTSGNHMAVRESGFRYLNFQRAFTIHAMRLG
jgi:hypothetical protein